MRLTLRPLLLFGMALMLITAGATVMLTTASIVRRQRIAVSKFYEYALRDKKLAPGLEHSPRLLKVMNLAAGERQGIELSIVLTAVGLMVGAVGVYVAQDRPKVQ